MKGGADRLMKRKVSAPFIGPTVNSIIWIDRDGTDLIATHSCLRVRTTGKQIYESRPRVLRPVEKRKRQGVALPLVCGMAVGQELDRYKVTLPAGPIQNAVANSGSLLKTVHAGAWLLGTYRQLCFILELHRGP